MKNPIDIYIGQRLRALRQEQGLSQQKLARALNVSFQQVQKYESATNRIAASRLYDLAKILNVCVLEFYPAEPANGRTSKKRPPHKAAFFAVFYNEA